MNKWILSWYDTLGCHFVDKDVISLCWYIPINIRIHDSYLDKIIGFAIYSRREATVITLPVTFPRPYSLIYLLISSQKFTITTHIVYTSAYVNVMKPLLTWRPERQLATTISQNILLSRIRVHISWTTRLSFLECDTNVIELVLPTKLITSPVCNIKCRLRTYFLHDVHQQSPHTTILLNQTVVPVIHQIWHLTQQPVFTQETVILFHRYIIYVDAYRSDCIYIRLDNHHVTPCTRCLFILQITRFVCKGVR